MEPNPSDFTMPPTVQSYVKLHGSVNWVESSIGQRVLIVGGQKAVSIGRYPILTWYHEEVSEDAPAAIGPAYGHRL
jgi:hypothetical protein